MRRIVDDVIEDKVPVAQYTITSVLRKGKVEYSEPLTPQQVKTAREVIGSKRTEEQLTYAELDRVIRAGRQHVPRFIAKGSIQPQGALAHKLRLRDPGSAPVPGF